jgi:polyisoprenyl-phosphate glycosyltransferase
MPSTELFSARLGSAAAKPALSVVVPVYDEAANLPALYLRLLNSLDELLISFEIIFADDGSRDESPSILAKLAASDSRIVVVSLSRNFGHQPAVCAGLDHARGEYIAIMDGDLQDPPEVLPRLLDAVRAGADVAYAVRTRRKEGPLKRLGYFVFYRLLRRVAECEMPLDAGDFCLMARPVADAVRGLPERDRFVRGLRAYVGFRQIGVPYERDARAAGVPKYTFRKLVGLAAAGVVNFSAWPLRAVLYSGIILITVGIVCTIAAAVVASGLLALAGVVLCAAGVPTVGLGVVGEYVRRIFLEVKGRPPYIVKAVTRAATVRHEIAA